MAYDNTNRGSIWKNERKEKETQADFTGTINVDGTDYWLNGWKRKEGADPKSPAMTFSVRKKEARDSHPSASRVSVGHPTDVDEIPF